jgi:hypothetical protein
VITTNTPITGRQFYQAQQPPPLHKNKNKMKNLKRNHDESSKASDLQQIGSEKK